ncbi:phenylalanine--tRNA ligase alpha subunit isoform 1 [Pontoporia blainvillei]|uniref:Phenylalanine--tRNA ligase alpha subunit n=1 Tax=Pontoporia blainvillei TaxID=48723 RepID=A0ABX0S3F8_PONBL|nr:phenylalanine--tRNA ligase alpha subunit isoform 1 [Pontoporia blainvillei]
MADGPVAEVLLQRLEAADGGLDSAELAAELGVEHQTVVGAVKSLQALGEIIEAELRSTKRWELTTEGEEIAREGSHEARVFRSVPPEGLPQSELMRLPSGKVGFSKAMSNKWIRVDKSAADGPRVFRVVDSVEDEVQRRLQLVQGGQAEKLGEKERSELRKRKLLTEVNLKTYWVSKGSAFSTSISKQETELSPEMISSGSWRDRPFKPYNFSAHGVLPDSGHLHPLLKVRTQFRQIFLEMGFTEMPTDNYIESSFWNFDALFQPQQHPARDQHDTFFLRVLALRCKQGLKTLLSINVADMNQRFQQQLRSECPESRGLLTLERVFSGPEERCQSMWLVQQGTPCPGGTRNHEVRAEEDLGGKRGLDASRLSHLGNGQRRGTARTGPAQSVIPSDW